MIPPYHLFCLKDIFFLFETSTHQLYEIDEKFYKFLDNNDKGRLMSDSMPISDVGLDMHEIEDCKLLHQKLIENGLLVTHEYLPDIKFFDNIKSELIKTPVRSIDLMLAESCNLACRYCFCRNNNKKNKLMTIATARAAIDFLVNNSLENSDICINFFGGEPLLNKKVLIDSLAYATNVSVQKNRKIHFSMTTNATLMDEDIQQLIINYNIGIMVSLDGPKEIHDAQCPTLEGGGSYDSAITNIDSLIDKGKPVSVRCTLAHPLPNLLELVEFYKSKKFSNIVIEPAINNESSCSNVDLTFDDMQELIRQEKEELPDILQTMTCKKRPARFPYDAQFAIFTRQSRPSLRSQIYCHAAITHVCIDTSGIVYPCPKFLGITSCQLGHISQPFNREKTLDFWKRASVAFCNNCGDCWAFVICPGMCPGDFIDGNGEFVTRKSLSCMRQCAKIENGAFLYQKYMQLNQQLTKERESDEKQK